jgi:hypothetical protein
MGFNGCSTQKPKKPCPKSSTHALMRTQKTVPPSSTALIADGHAKFQTRHFPVILKNNHNGPTLATMGTQEVPWKSPSISRVFQPVPIDERISIYS